MTPHSEPSIHSQQDTLRGTCDIDSEWKTIGEFEVNLKKLPATVQDLILLESSGKSPSLQKSTKMSEAELRLEYEIMDKKRVLVSNLSKDSLLRAATQWRATGTSKEEMGQTILTAMKMLWQDGVAPLIDVQTTSKQLDDIQSARRARELKISQPSDDLSKDIKNLIAIYSKNKFDRHAASKLEKDIDKKHRALYGVSAFSLYRPSVIGKPAEIILELQKLLDRVPKYASREVSAQNEKFRKEEYAMEADLETASWFKEIFERIRDHIDTEEYTQMWLDAAAALPYDPDMQNIVFSAAIRWFDQTPFVPGRKKRDEEQIPVQSSKTLSIPPEKQKRLSLLRNAFRDTCAAIRLPGKKSEEALPNIKHAQMILRTILTLVESSTV